MAIVRPFRALRPRPSDAARVAAVPYDVVNTEEARSQAGDNPLSFLRVSRSEVELPPATDPFSGDVYSRAARNFERLKQSTLVVEDEASVYLYRLRSGAHEQTGLAACFSLDEYDSGLIKRHELTRRDKEDDRTRHMLALGAQTGPVFLVYRASDAIDALAARAIVEAPLFDFTAPDGVRHTVWRATSAIGSALVSAFAQIASLYIADGHHRAASAARARDAIRDGTTVPALLDGDADHTTFLAVAFPHEQVRILPYNRVVRDLGALAPPEFLSRVRQRFRVDDGHPMPSGKGEIAMYFEGQWRTLAPRAPSNAADPIGSLDVTVLQQQLLEPILGIRDVRTDGRIEFVGGGRGVGELERLVDSGAAAVAFSLYPVNIVELMNVSDAGAMMPPKSTWFEPKLRDGLLIHSL